MSEILEVNGKVYIGVLNLDCGHCHLNSESCVAEYDKRCSNLNLVWKKMEDNNDLSNVNGLIYTVQNGWERAVDSREDETYCIVTAGGAYTVCGRYDKDDKHPSAWLEPPEFFNAEPKPCEFKKGDKVFVKQRHAREWRKAYFHNYDGEYYFCYPDGKTEWTSGNMSEAWNQCKKA